jgi:hypothetical protein
LRFIHPAQFCCLSKMCRAHYLVLRIYYSPSRLNILQGWGIDHSMPSDFVSSGPILRGDVGLTLRQREFPVKLLKKGKLETLDCR